MGELNKYQKRFQDYIHIYRNALGLKDYVLLVDFLDARKEVSEQISETNERFNDKLFERLEEKIMKRSR